MKSRRKTKIKRKKRRRRRRRERRRRRKRRKRRRKRRKRNSGTKYLNTQVSFPRLIMCYKSKAFFFRPS